LVWGGRPAGVCHRSHTTPLSRSPRRFIAPPSTPPGVGRAPPPPPRQGKIAPLVHQVFPLAEAREAMATMERREHFGKIVLKPAA
jgi:hypothetical protein